MGKNTSAKNIIQNSKNIENNLWNLKYFEKKKIESPLYLYIALELKKLLKIFLKKNGLILCHYKINLFESELKIFVSYSKLDNSLVLINQVLKSKRIKSYNSFKKKVSKKAKKKLKDYTLTESLTYSKIKNEQILYSFFYHKQISKTKSLLKNKLNKKLIDYRKKYLFETLLLNYCKNIRYFSKPRGNLLTHSLKYIEKYNSFLQKRNHKILNSIKLNNFLETLFESLNIFLTNKLNIKIIFSQTNKDVYHLFNLQQLQVIKKVITQLRRFKDSKFVNESINLLILIVTKRKTAKLLSSYIALQFKQKKNHNVFFNFLKQLLSLLFVNNILKVKGIKIVIQGRFNRAPRSRKKVIFIGKRMPLMTLNSNMQYSKSTSYTLNGTFGVKVWINE